MTPKLDWVRSSHSGSEGGECVEVAVHPDARHVHIRDSKDATRPALTVTLAAWVAFVAAAAVSRLSRLTAPPLGNAPADVHLPGADVGVLARTRVA